MKKCLAIYLVVILVASVFGMVMGTASSIEKGDKYELTVNIEEEGTVEIDPNQDEYEEGTNVTLEIEEKDEENFEKWNLSDDLVGDHIREEKIQLEEEPPEGWQQWEQRRREEWEEKEKNATEITVTMLDDYEITAVFEDEVEEEDDDEDTPGFTSMILVLSIIIAVSIYHKKKE